MKSQIVRIDNNGNGFSDALEQTTKISELSPKNTLRLKLLAEEMLSLARSVTGEMQASFWVEREDGLYTLHMTTKTVMDKEKRAQLLMSATSRKNEAAKGFLGKLRDVFEQAMAAEVVHNYEEVPYELRNDLAYAHQEDPEWDGYERSILRKLADDVKIAIRGGTVEMTVAKRFEE